jgi:hypothetical protein
VKFYSFTPSETSLREAALRRDCSLENDFCTDCKTDNSRKLRCHCAPSPDLDEMHDVRRRLPLILQHYEVHRTTDGSVAITSPYVPIQASLQLLDYRIALTTRAIACSVTPHPLSGCYACTRGTNLTFTCEATADILVLIRCPSTTLLQFCEEGSHVYTQTMNFNQPVINERCDVHCGSSKTSEITSTITLAGRLDFVPLIHETGTSIHFSSDQMISNFSTITSELTKFPSMIFGAWWSMLPFDALRTAAIVAGTVVLTGFLLLHFKLRLFRYFFSV